MLDKNKIRYDLEQGTLRRIFVDFSTFLIVPPTTADKFMCLIDEITSEKEKNVWYGTFKNWEETTGEKVASVYGTYNKQTKKIDVVIRKTFRLISEDGTPFEVQFFPMVAGLTDYITLEYHIVSADDIFTKKEKEEYMKQPGMREKLNKTVCDFIFNKLK